MSFLSIAFLLALPLAAVPLVLHLFDRRRNTVIQWGAMQFLMEASARKTSARRLKQWLLLLLRCLALAALVFALARPLIPSGYLGGSEKGETIFVFDNSLSMSRTDSTESMVERAVKRAREILAELPPHEDVRVLTTAPYPVWNTLGRVRGDVANHHGIESQFETVRPTLGRSDLLAALFTAVQAEHESDQSLRRIVVLTDGQAADWRLEDQHGWARLHQALNEAPIRTEIQLLRIDPPAEGLSKGNVAVDEVSIDRMMVGVDQAVTALATLHNYGPARITESRVVWRVDGRDFEEQIVEVIEGQQTAQARWRHAFEGPGTYHISCHIEHDDGLPADNQASFVVEVVDRIPIMIVENAFEYAEMQQDSYFIQAALGWIDGEPLGDQSIYVPTLIPGEQLANADLSLQRAVVIPNLTRLDHDAIEKLTEFVSEGGGLWVGLGPRTEVDTFNQQWFADASGLAPLRLDRVIDSQSPDASDQEENGPGGIEPLRIDPFRSRHPATRHVADDSQLDLSDAVVTRRFQFVLGETPESVSALLRLSNGDPLVVENFVGKGRVLIQAVPLRLQWSDLARTQSFVVMVRDWVDYLAQPKATQYNLEPGQPIAFRINEADSGADSARATAPTALLRTPQRDAIELAAQQVDNGYLFQSSRTRSPGDYQLEVGLAERPVPFHVRRSAEESDLDPLGADAWQRLAAATTPSPTRDKTRTTASAHSDPVWPYLLLALIALITGELVLSGVLARERFGSAGIVEHADFGGDLVTAGAAPSHPMKATPAMNRSQVASTEVVGR